MTTKQIFITIGAAGAVVIVVGGTALAAGASKPGSLANRIAQDLHLAPKTVATTAKPGGRLGASGRFGGGNPQAYQQRLDAAVAAGTITSAQEQAIMSEHNSFISFVQGLSGKSAADRRSAIQQELQSVQAWAQQNNVPVSLVIGFGGRRGGYGGGSGNTQPSTPGTSSGTSGI